MPYPIEASCQCGQLSYQLFAAPLMVLACHCTQCQKLSTGPFSVTAVVAASAIKFSGELKQWSRSSASGNTNTAKFCPACGNRIYHFNPADTSLIKLKLKPVGPLGESLFTPSLHVWTSQKQSWYQLPEGVESLEQQN